MPDAEIRRKVFSLLTGANGKTSGSDSNLTAAVQRLMDGYRQGTGGSVSPVSKGVNFIDYDGTVIESWDAADVSGKVALPSNPEHEGLTAQGWNWSLANIKSYINKYHDSVVWVGQMYITNDGKTRIYIHLTEGRLSPYLGICPNGRVEIDWGDGSIHGSVSGTSTTTVKNTQHTYASAGDYVITLTVTGSMAITGNSSYGSQLLWNNRTSGYLNRCYQNAVQKIEIGTGVTTIANHAFRNCYSLASVTIPDGVTTIANYAFINCFSLASVTIPDSVTTIADYAFNNCYSLASVTIPDSVSSIGNYAFQNCYSLASVTIPDSVAGIGNYVFQNCYSLASVTIPDSVTTIADYAFNNCYSLASVTIPDSVASIGIYAFNSCYCLGLIRFEPTTPPAVSNANAWSNSISGGIIYVPRGTLSAYTSAENYPSTITYTYVEY